ncbi:hypothetical protein [Thauera linaloolentis]|uniref:Uncharacterized protein n=1 Tax=Thauera linaloolentis (strain DSM 12138 / JCM 21573 / CCUG 41526 / CIP 105981 / IAM 15112 / NBRC 102519 / 47Lol) TaxID=1123367 RepID=N6YTS6_THAL4|nr:hypothetical protein [Thauera linaloolentis]ENO85797.1 hypothetical protein C666_14645 [Thauera linaloolentis 47Lol = DSM 12138]MCM8564491.1 hypothetical protein [Thauera linaloolentis]
MNPAADPSLLVPRTCTTLDEDGQRRTGSPLADFRDVAAYVLLGDPGAGKTRCFEQEAAATGGHYVRARSFAALDPGPNLVGKTLFIDGLDEMRAGGGDGRTPLDHVRRHLDRLGRPRFRLSCREADWYGDSDQAALREAAPEGSLSVLHLDPLSNADIILLLERKFAIADPAGFVRQAKHHGLADLLHNPQTLELLVKAVGDTTWPDSRAATYDLACQQLVREINPEHRLAKRHTAPTIAMLLEAAGFLCAVQLLAGTAGFALDDDAADDQHVLWRELSPPRELPLPAALASGLFQRDEREQQRVPVHRSIAEYLGARYLAELIDAQGLPLGRVVALLAGDDGGILPDLRGLAAWLAVHCRSARAELVQRDPLGTILYGDVRGFPPDDKRHVLAALKGEAERYPHFRFEDWTAAPFGTLATPDMLPVFLAILAALSRAAADIALLDCVLDALRYGPPLAELAAADELPRLDALLDAVMRDPSYPSGIRNAALKILLRDLPRNADRLVALAEHIHAETVEDKDDELLGRLLTELFPEFIRAAKVFDFLHREKKQHLIGSYRMFWSHRLPKGSPDGILSELLDQLAKRRPKLYEPLDHFRAERMAGSLLARGLEIHGDAISDVRLYDWLGAGFDRYDHPRIDGEHQRRIAAWLAARPERYKAVLLEGTQRCAGEEKLFHHLWKNTSRLYGAEPPADIATWYLDRAAVETHTEIKQHFFSQAVRRLVQQGGQEWLTPDALDSIGPWMAEHPEFERNLEPFVSCRIDDWRRDDAIHRRERAQWLEGQHSRFRVHLDTIREGRAHPQILHELAQVYLIGHLDIDGETPHKRLATFLSDDLELIEAAYAGFRRALDRNDLPDVAEVVDQEIKGREHFIRQPCLVGMEELYRSDPATALQLDDEVLRKLLAFRLTWGIGEAAEWFTALVRTRPALVAQVLVAYARPLLRKGKEHLHGIWPLAYDDDYAAVARLVLPDLLKGFPLRARKTQLNSVLDPLLKAALRHLDRLALAAIVSTRLAQGSMSAAQRVRWLACGLMISPDEYEQALAAHVGASKALRAHLGAFLHDNERRSSPNAASLPESSLALLIELLASGSPPERPAEAHWVSPAMRTADDVRTFIETLGSNPSDAAQQQLERLLALPQLAAWHDRLQRAAHVQRIARRKAGARHPDTAEVCRTLANREPANAADLAALAEAHLRDLARRIRDGSTNDYRQYWSYDAKRKPARPKPENDCRDILLSDLAERLGRLGVDAIKEGHYAEDKRADICVSFGGAAGFNVPIEIKKDSHPDLWRAMHEQLIGRYIRDPGTGGCGIYLVFWFGGENMPLPQTGKKPRSAAELEQRLRSMLTKDEASQLAVVVIDCALPVGSKG